MADFARVLSLTTKVDTTRAAVVKELESAVAIAREIPDRVIGCAVVIVTLSEDDGLHHVHTNVECPKNACLQMSGAVQVLAQDVLGYLEKYPAFEPEPESTPDGNGDDR